MSSRGPSATGGRGHGAAFDRLERTRTRSSSARSDAPPDSARSPERLAVQKAPVAAAEILHAELVAVAMHAAVLTEARGSTRGRSAAPAPCDRYQSLDRPLAGLELRSACARPQISIKARTLRTARHCNSGRRCRDSELRCRQRGGRWFAACKREFYKPVDSPGAEGQPIQIMLQALPDWSVRSRRSRGDHAVKILDILVPHPITLGAGAYALRFPGAVNAETGIRFVERSRACPGYSLVAEGISLPF